LQGLLGLRQVQPRHRALRGRLAIEGRRHTLAHLGQALTRLGKGRLRLGPLVFQLRPALGRMQAQCLVGQGQLLTQGAQAGDGSRRGLTVGQAMRGQALCQTGFVMSQLRAELVPLLVQRLQGELASARQGDARQLGERALALATQGADSAAVRHRELLATGQLPLQLDAKAPQGEPGVADGLLQRLPLRPGLGQRLEGFDLRQQRRALLPHRLASLPAGLDLLQPGLMMGHTFAGFLQGCLPTGLLAKTRGLVALAHGLSHLGLASGQLGLPGRQGGQG
jgi:hypothetical protein